MVIDGKKIAEETLTELKKLPRPEKFLAAVFVGDDIASASFLKQKEKVAHELGVDFRIHRLAMSIDQDALRKEVLKIAQHQTCGGVVVQLPLPTHINRQYVLNAIPREKDVDVLGERALGAFYAGRNPVLPPAVGVVETIIHNSKFIIQNSRVAIVGLGFLVGKPIAAWLAGKCAEIFALDLGSDFNILKDADVVISGVGKAGILKPEMLKDDALVIDFGYSRKQIANSKWQIVGDFDASSASSSLSQSSSLAYTPTPGGTGPILVAQLFQNFFTLVALQK